MKEYNDESPTTSMLYHYIRVILPKEHKKLPKNKRLKEFFIAVLSKIIPKANLDFDDLIDNVSEWLIEIKVNGNKPNREIGIDNNGDVIMVFPWDPDYGYWTDNNLLLNDFKKNFNTTDITQEEFNKKWNEYVTRPFKETIKSNTI